MIKDKPCIIFNTLERNIQIQELNLSLNLKIYFKFKAMSWGLMILACIFTSIWKQRN